MIQQQSVCVPDNRSLVEKIQNAIDNSPHRPCHMLVYNPRYHLGTSYDNINIAEICHHSGYMEFYSDFCRDGPHRVKLEDIEFIGGFTAGSTIYRNLHQVAQIATQDFKQRRAIQMKLEMHNAN